MSCNRRSTPNFYLTRTAHVFLLCYFSYLTMMPKIRQALVEFERLEDAINCVRSTQENQIYILDRPVFFNFSTSQEITRYKATYSIFVHPLILSMTFRSPYGYSPSTQTPPQEEPPMNNILLYTIFNPIYPITVVSLVIIRSILL